jgi:serine/threonine-protein kinase
MTGERKPRTKLSSALAPRKAPKPLVGQTVLDRYLVERELASGSMGKVFRGLHTQLGRPVAIKVMHDHLAGERVLLERFRREGRVAGRLAHPNIVPVFDVGSLADGRPVMVMELVEGVQFADLMTLPMPRARVFALLGQVLDGLGHAHDMGLVHRDLKPENIIVEPGDVPRIADFGIAVLRGTEEEQRLTGTGVIIGTPLYMAPEQAKGEKVDHRADLYAFGIILYELLAGTEPFAGTAMEVASKKIDHDPPRIAGLEPALERYLWQLIARDPAARFQTARAAREALDQIASTDIAKALAVISLPARVK